MTKRIDQQKRVKEKSLHGQRNRSIENYIPTNHLRHNFLFYYKLFLCLD